MRAFYLTSAMLSVGFACFASDSPAFTLHEWGTFTSVSGSDGVLLPGLQLEEEALPTFVMCHDGIRSVVKGYMRPLANVTIKMETPVIYFYTSNAFDAHVSVGFNGGSISQWFPQRSGGETPPPIQNNNGFLSGGGIDFAKEYKGGIEWNVHVQPPAENDNQTIFKPGETPTWLHPRQTDSALVVNSDGAAEKYLFYRGLGNFTLPVKFTFPSDGTLHIENVSQGAVPTMLIFNHQGYGDNVSFILGGPLKAGESRELKLPDPATSANWRHDVYDAMRGKLVEAGLYPKEADAMLQTWWNSYFERPGLRVFWITPENFTRAILPMKVEPAPGNITRVLVGRSELLAPAFEKDLVKQFAQPNQNPWLSDRYSIAFGARVKALNTAN